MNVPIKVALIGAGRIGQEHAKNLASFPNVEVAVICDPIIASAERVRPLARAGRVTDNVEDALKSPGVQAVVICTPTDTHADLIEAAAHAGKAVFCEKPVALDLDRTRQALKAVEEKGAPFQIGFQRRFDTGYAEAKRRLDSGELGRIDQFRAVGRDPAPPPREYLAKSGGIFIDQAIHDFDIARFLGGEIEEVSAWGAARFDENVAALGDIDTATTLLRFESGALGVIENSRKAVYGYDIVTEIFGEHGKIVIQAEPKTPIRQYSEKGYQLDHYFFFMDRFQAAFRAELESFFKHLSDGSNISPSAYDALESLKISVAATKSWKEGRPVKISEVS
jgi:myo-inositol 2-dehydrogenase / D-chiro-inositol 1-dehydrogenase